MDPLGITIVTPIIIMNPKPYTVRHWKAAGL